MILRKLTYIRTGWLPTHQANGIQTIQMCEAFAQLGLQVALYYIPSPVMKDDIFNYYAVKTPFLLRPLPRGILPFRKHFVWESWRSLPYYIHAFLWSGVVACLAERSKADIYFTREPMVAWWLGHIGLPTILELHTCPFATLDKKILISTTRCRKINLVISVTDYLKRDLMALGIPKDKIIVLHDGVSLDLFTTNMSKQEIRNNLKLPTNKPLIVYTGSFHKNRGIITLLKTANLLTKMNVYFVLVGGTFHQIKKITQEFGLPHNVIMIGYVPHITIPKYLISADILILPQYDEDMHTKYYASPLKLFEYMAAERPIIASDLPCIREVVRNGETAILVEPNSPESFARSIVWVLQNYEKAKIIARNARLEVEKYSWQKRAINIINHIRYHGVNK